MPIQFRNKYLMEEEVKSAMLKELLGKINRNQTGELQEKQFDELV